MTNLVMTFPVMTDKISSNCWVYLETRKGMPGLKQDGRIANDQLKAHLPHFGFAPVPITPALWKLNIKPILVSLVVDNFGVKYIVKENADHLIQALQKFYTISINWTGSLFFGLVIDWDYAARTCDISMPEYLKKAMLKFQHTAPKRPQHAQHSWAKPTYGGAHIQYA